MEDENERLRNALAETERAADQTLVLSDVGSARASGLRKNADTLRNIELLKTTIQMLESSTQVARSGQTLAELADAEAQTDNFC